MKSIKKFILPATLASLPAMTAEVNTVFEAAFESSKVQANPFVDVEVDVRFSKDGREWRVPAFRGGGMTWKVRSAAPEEAVYHYRAVANDPSDPGLNFTGRMFTATAYSGGNPLHRRGRLRVTDDKRHFEFADGTPFFWLGDTWWKGLCKRIPFEGFKELTADCKRKGFTVVQIVCGTYPDELGLLQPGWENEGGMSYLAKDFSVVNPECFRYADRRIQHLA